jgi:hypothetical protein
VETLWAFCYLQQIELSNNCHLKRQNGEIAMADRICKVPYDKRTWKDVPHTNAHAKVAKYRKALDVMALCVENANIREATVSGWFEVADVENPFTYERRSLTVQVKCHWYGLRSETENDWMHLRITNAYQFVRRFSGDVVDNIE